MMNIAPNKQTPANVNILPWKPIVSFKNGKYLVAMNANSQISERQIELPRSLRFSGITSEIIKNGRVTTAQDAMNNANEKLARGTQLYASTS